MKRTREQEAEWGQPPTLYVFWPRIDFALGLATAPALPGESANHVDPVENDGEHRRFPDFSKLPFDALLAVRWAQHIDDSGNRDENDNRADA